MSLRFFLAALIAISFSKAYAAPEGWTLLHEAASSGSISAAEGCIELGIPIDVKDESGSTPLHVAAMRGLTEMTRMLLAKGARVDITDTGGFLAYERAAHRGHIRLSALIRLQSMLSHTSNIIR